MKPTQWLTIAATAMLLLSSGCSTDKAGRTDVGAEPVDPAAAAPAPERWPREKATPDHLALAKELVERGYYQVALGQLEESGKTREHTAEVYTLMGTCHQKLGDLDKAADCFRRALKAEKNYGPAHNGLGINAGLQNDPQAAVAALEAAVGSNPARADFYNNLGMARMTAGDLTGAEAAFRQSLALDSGFRRAAHNLAVCAGLAGREKEALTRLMELFPKATALNNLGAIREMKGELAGAAALYRQALALDPQLDLARRNLERLEDSAGPTVKEKTNLP
ncbi:tetratricopeptide repeat protein [uncultured Desulfosarcina sp.]|uniref:tetratricopeptide repeat protein n=1 Tax=uncultured Desulfosarcina sp. TaxID=218289 RepID=UPI0029C96888|nr:tetratricopeptide repeat protein [uncultured Desulfosarcina sp.]